ncbi:MAG: hypothetical protein ACIARR_09630, partial [Phycisphaerales bacterium JB059]
MKRTTRMFAFVGLAMLLLALAPAWTGVTRTSTAAPQEGEHAASTDDGHGGDHAGDHGDPSPIAGVKEGLI